MTLAVSNPIAGQAGTQTVEDYLALTDDKGSELVDGRLVEKNMGSRSGWIGGQLFYLIHFFLNTHRLGWVFASEAAYQCFPGHPNRIRKPDVSFIRYGRLANEQIPDPFIAIAPDLAAEVISRHDTALEVDRKVNECLQAGVRLVWVVNPDLRTVRIHRADGTINVINDRGQVGGEDVLPVFQFAVAELFPETAAIKPS
jgi:Uma2 family endonuclease